MSVTAAAALQNRRHRDEREALIGLCNRLRWLAHQMMCTGDEWFAKRFVGETPTAGGSRCNDPGSSGA